MQLDDLALAVGVHRHSDYRRHRDDPAALALLEVGRVQPQIRPLAEQRTVKERMNPPSMSLHSLETCDLPIPLRPIACTRSSTRRVETPPIHASWITAINAFSETFRASRNGGK